MDASRLAGLVILLAGGIWCGCASQREDAGRETTFQTGSRALDGRAFRVDLVGDDEKPQPDDLVFEQGSFDSTACRTYGFSPAPYATRQTDEAVEFEADTRSPTGGSIHWSGIARSEAIAGSMVWTDSKGVVTKYHYEGNRLP